MSLPKVLELTNGSMPKTGGTFTGNITISSGGLNLTTGNIELTDGDITSTEGNIALTEGNLTLTKGDVAVNNGDFLIKDTATTNKVSIDTSSKEFLVQNEKVTVEDTANNTKLVTDTVNKKFTWTEDGKDYSIVKVLDNGLEGASAHNAIYRGKDLTSLYGSATGLAALSAKVASQDWSDLFIGDYITMTLPKLGGSGTEEVDLVIADFDYLLGVGDVELTTPHILMVTKDCMSETCQWNTTNTCETGYRNSLIYSKVVAMGNNWNAAAYLNGHMLTGYKALFTHIMSTTAIPLGGNIHGTGQCYWDSNSSGTIPGQASGTDWQVAPALRLMNEPMVFGTVVSSSSFADVGECTRQLSLFRLNHKARIAGLGKGGSRYYWWLSAVACSTVACYCNSDGGAYRGGASDARGVRPFFLFS